MVITIDDLDRCSKPKIVNMLEAVHLLLQIPSAPIIAFLAIDPRIVIAAIEDTLGDRITLQATKQAKPPPACAVAASLTLPTDKTLKECLEYLDKIIHLPFCIPPSGAEALISLLKQHMKAGIFTTVIRHCGDLVITPRKLKRITNMPFRYACLVFMMGTIEAATGHEASHQDAKDSLHTLFAAGGLQLFLKNETTWEKDKETDRHHRCQRLLATDADGGAFERLLLEGDMTIERIRKLEACLL
ncbi:hypothetical protein JKP88DRAFT_280941 [Tribonema minus]|uniref:KAP NTPase domain-containing protein n=1 Tax=Tribonema minus TaxID=303371 RepID=A0A835YXA7_9STRA|nr:hypothetical protein JKP88DRAFT_280941 [Tribonema minus]